MDAKLLPYLSDVERGWLALAEAATPGPWICKKWYIGVRRAGFLPIATMFQHDHDADAAFIAAARTALPAALEALALARRDAEEVRSAILEHPPLDYGSYCWWCDEFDKYVHDTDLCQRTKVLRHLQSILRGTDAEKSDPRFEDQP